MSERPRFGAGNPPNEPGVMYAPKTNVRHAFASLPFSEPFPIPVGEPAPWPPRMQQCIKFPSLYRNTLLDRKIGSVEAGRCMVLMMWRRRDLNQSESTSPT